MSEKKHEPIRVNWMDVEELAAQILNLDYNSEEVDHDVIELAMAEKFNIDLDIFQNIVELLLPLVDVGKSPITNEVFKGFSVLEDEESGLRRWIIKHNPNS